MKGMRIANVYLNYLLPIVVAIGLFGCSANPAREQPVDLSAWHTPQQGDVAGVTGLWYGIQKCSRYLGPPLDVLVGVRHLGGNRYEVLAAAAHQSTSGTLSSLTDTLTLDSTGNGQVFKGSKAKGFALRYVRLGSNSRDDDLKVLVLDYDASEKRRIDECPAASLSRLDDPSQSPLLRNWSLENPASFAGQKQLFGLRNDLSGQWQGLANCKGGSLPVDLTLSQDPSNGWLADLVINGQSEKYRMIPSPSPGRRDAYRFEPIGEPAVAHLGGLQGGIIDKYGRAVWMKLAMVGGCRDNLLYRHWQLPDLSGEYADTTDLNSFCETVHSHWIGDVTENKARAESVSELLSATPWRYPAEKAMRWMVNDGERFLNTFGVPLEEITSSTYSALTSQLASCGAIGAKHLREDFRTGLFKAGTLQRFDPRRRDYPLYTSRDTLVQLHQQALSVDELLARANTEKNLSGLDKLMVVAGEQVASMDPARLYPRMKDLVQHRARLQTEATAREHARILREGPPPISAAVLNSSIHQFMKKRLRAADTAASVALQLPPGFTYTCGAENYCTAIGGIVKYRYYVASLIGCDYAGKLQARCEYRLGLDVQSTLSSSSDFRNRLLAGQGALLAAEVFQSYLDYRDWEWVIADGIAQKK